MPNFIDVMDKLSVIDQQMTSLLSVNDLPTLNRLEEMDKKLDGIINIINAMMNDDKETKLAQLRRDEYDKGNRYDT